MELQDFTEKEQEQIKQGLSEAVISDKEAGKIRFSKRSCNSSKIFVLDYRPEIWARSR